MDENLVHCSYEAGVILEDPNRTPVSALDFLHFGAVSGNVFGSDCFSLASDLTRDCGEFKLIQWHLLTVTQPKDLWKMTLDPLDAADSPTEFSIHFEKGIPVKVVLGDQEATDSVELFKLLNKIGHDNGVGRIDIVETRLVGIKSRGCYDTPGLTIA